MTSRSYFEYYRELLPFATFRAMMGEYIVYYDGKVVGGLYDDRFLIKITPSSKELLPDAEEAIPYEGAKKMLLVESEDKTLLQTLCKKVASEILPRRK